MFQNLTNINPDCNKVKVYEVFRKKMDVALYLGQDYEIGRLNMSNHFILYNYLQSRKSNHEYTYINGILHV